MSLTTPRRFSDWPVLGEELLFSLELLERRGIDANAMTAISHA